MRTRRSDGSARRGAVAALTGVATAELVARFFRTTGPVDGASRLVVDSVPVPIVETTVRVLGRYDKRATRAGVVATVALAGVTVRSSRLRVVTTLGLSAAGGLLSVRRPPRRPVVAAAGAAAGAAAALASDRSTWALPAAVVATAAGVLTARRRSGQRSRLVVDERTAPSPEDGAETWAGTTPLITSTDRFYVTDVNLGAPPIDVDRYELRMDGAVAQPTSLRYDELRTRLADPFVSVLVCIHNRVGGIRLGNAVWRGVPFAEVCRMVGPDPRARFVSTVAVDGFRATIPLELLKGSSPYGGWIVVDMNGAPLTPTHGGPARFLVPGIYGQYNGAKWLTRLEFHEHHPGDYWTPRGWPHGPMAVRPLSRLDRPTRTQNGVVVTGVAWAPPYGVQSVHVEVDGDRHVAELAREVDPRSWRRFRAEFKLPPGRHALTSRCVSTRGEVQDELSRPPFPVGATGLHRVDVEIR